MEKQEYELTVIMSNYNQEKYIVEAIDSVLSQLVNFRYRLIITDDFSCKDHSRDIITYFANKYNNIDAFFSTENKGYLTNILRAKEKTKTKYFCLLDADDYYTDMFFLQRAVDFLNKHDEYTIYEANVRIITTDNNKYSKQFISPKMKTGTYSKEMFLNNKVIPITQTTGMLFRNSIFINGIPDIIKKSIGTRGERSFEGDTGRFIMHLKYGLAYYDNSIVGVYRLSKDGIWSSMKNSRKFLVRARSYIDYYQYYETNVDFFVNKAYKLIQKYFLEKQNEFNNMSFFDTFVDEYERNMVNDVCFFCKQYENNIIVENGVVDKLKNILKIIKS